MPLAESNAAVSCVFYVASSAAPLVDNLLCCSAEP